MCLEVEEFKTSVPKDSIAKFNCDAEHNHSHSDSGRDSTLYLNSFKYPEILFDLFPSIFMPYLDVYTFCELLKTDLWNWHHLLSDRIVFDYCHYISQRTETHIAEFCAEPTYDAAERAILCHNDHNDSYHDYDCENYELELYDESNLKCDPHQDEEQNFAVLRLMTESVTEINDMFIFSNFKYLDIIRDRMWFTTFNNIGLTTNLCKNIVIEDAVENRMRNDELLLMNDPNNKIFVYQTYNDLCQDLESKQIYTHDTLAHVKHILLADILSLCRCIHKWYFVQWHQDNEQQLGIMQIKQMIVGHFNPYHNINKQSNSINKKQELFVAWSIGWQSSESSEST